MFINLEKIALKEYLLLFEQKRKKLKKKAQKEVKAILKGSTRSTAKNFLKVKSNKDLLILVVKLTNKFFERSFLWFGINGINLKGYTKE